MSKTAKQKKWQGWAKGDGKWFRLCLALAPLLLVFAVEFTTRVSPASALKWMAKDMGPLLLTYLVMLAVMVLMTAATKRLWVGILIPTIPALILCVVNYLKLSVNGVGLVISDLAMAGHAGTLLEFMPKKLRVPIWGLVMTVLLVADIVAAKLMAKELPGWLQGKRKRGVAALVALAVAAATLLAPWFYYTGPKEESQDERSDRLGLLLGLYGGALRAASRPMNGPPEDITPVDPSEIIETLVTPTPTPEASATPAPKVKPTVIMLMSESFCDPEVMLPGVELEGDPIANYHALAKNWPSGVFLSNTYAGGTGNVEMEAFTGIPVGLVSEREDLTTLSAEGAYEKAPSIVRAFADAGYHTVAIHSYTDRLYNRRENFPAIGFEDVMFQDDFPEDAPTAGPYLSDMALTQAGIRALEEKEEGEPMFLYLLSMNNHQPIFAEKYEEPSGFDPKCDSLDENDLGSLDALMQGLHDADEALGALVDYLEDYDEPVILVFWGDHLPGLYTSPDHSVFSALGYVPTPDTAQWDAEVLKQMMSTEFVVWNNYGAELDVPEEIGGPYLGKHTLDWAGVEKPAYFQWLDVAEQEMKLYRPRLLVDGEGNPRSVPTEEDEELLNTFRKMLYDVLYAQEDWE